MYKAKIKEYFTSIQGEGPYVGYRQLFIRFCGCNLNCTYCDTDFSPENNCVEYTPADLFKELNSQNLLKNIHSISLTGGEPLVHADFLAEFLSLLGGKIPVYLETNATLTEALKKVINYTDIVAADIKLPSSSGQNLFNIHDNFFEICKNKKFFAKVVFDGSVDDFEIKQVCKLAKKHGIELILSPVMKDNRPVVEGKFITEIQARALNYYPNVRVIPQVHKFLNIE